MLHNLRRRVEEDRGFSMIELLVVILIIGILAAIAIPLLINQAGKGYDAAAKIQVGVAQRAMEVKANDNNGSYANISKSDLQAVEPSLSDTSGATLQGPTSTQNSYSVTSQARTTGDTFTVSRDSSGGLHRSCTGTGAGCVKGSW